MIKHEGCLIIETESWLAQRLEKNPSGMIEGAFLEKNNIPTVFPAYFKVEQSYTTKWWIPTTKEEIHRVWSREKERALAYYDSLLKNVK